MTATSCRPCASCVRDDEHCHGVLTLHVDGWLECSDPARCPGLDPVLHGTREACGPDGCRACVDYELDVSVALVA